MKSKKKKAKIEGKTDEEIKQMEHEQAKEELHQAELAMGYEQDEKYEESED
ncbi:MAG: hypothetical protein KGI28_07515 [Thaumarchaeota archaeon]|nr:hypothetical protein [Nitrososphaerota archaeon]